MTKLIHAALAFVFSIASASAGAQAYPARPVRMIVPFPPGGGTDLIARTVSQKLSETWQLPVVVENTPGSGGTIGLAAAARAAADGYTLVLAQAANAAIAPSLYARLAYDPLKDLAPVTVVVAEPLVMVSHPSFPASGIGELIARARAQPGRIAYGSAGNGTVGHLSVEMLKSMAGIDMLHVPYKGASQALTDLVGGQISFYSSSLPPALPQIKAGRIKALGVTGAKRLSALPDVPTLAESGVAGYEAANWYGVMVPGATPKPIVAKLHADLLKVLASADVAQRLAGEGGEIVANSSEEFAAMLRRETVKWSRVVRDAGVKVD
jgi:tripartite-type tricarboxylate transporter receptor subunit TctC